MKRFLVQILVVVAITQLRPLRTEVEMGSATTAIGCRLADPKIQVKSDERLPLRVARSKGNQVEIPELWRVVLNGGNASVSGEVSNRPGGGLSFLHNAPKGPWNELSSRYG